MWSWFVVAVLGEYDGLDPSMGWLFAVALGLQDRSRARVVGALGPIAIGHLLSIVSVVAIIVGLGRFFAIMYVRPAGAMVYPVRLVPSGLATGRRIRAGSRCAYTAQN